MNENRRAVLDFVEDEVIRRLCDADRFDPNDRRQFTIRDIEERLSWLESRGESCLECR